MPFFIDFIRSCRHCDPQIPELRPLLLSPDGGGIKTFRQVSFLAAEAQFFHPSRNGKLHACILLLLFLLLPIKMRSWLACLVLFLTTVASDDVKSWSGWKKVRNSPVASPEQKNLARENYPRMFNLKVRVHSATGQGPQRAINPHLLSSAAHANAMEPRRHSSPTRYVIYIYLFIYGSERVGNCRWW